MKRILATLAFVMAFAFLSALPARADCVELPDGGCAPGQPTSTPRASRTPAPTIAGATPAPTATPRPRALVATVRCNNATHYNEITVTVTATGPTNVWTESDMWAFKIEASGTGNYTKVLIHSATFNKMDLELRTTSGTVLGSATVHAVWGAGTSC